MFPLKTSQFLKQTYCKTICLLIFFIIIYSKGFTQNLNSILKYDTTILVPHLKKFHSLHRTVQSCIYDNQLHFIYLDRLNKVKIQIQTIDLNSKKAITNNLSLNPYKKLINNHSTIKGIIVNKNYLIINWIDFFAVYSRNKNNKFVFMKTFSFKQQNYEFMNFISEDKLLLGACYNSNPADSKNNALLTLYNVKSEDSISSQTVDFKDIEFTHFTPGKWIATTSNFIFFANTTDYTVRVYDTTLSLVQVLKNSVDNWSKIPDSLILNIKKQPRNVGKLLNILSEYNYDKINRLEEIWTINDSTLMVQYFEPGKEKYLQNRYCDLFKLTGNQLWHLSEKRLLNGSLNINGNQAIDTSVVISKDNWSIMSYNYAHLIGDNYLIIFDGTTPLPKTGIKYRERYLRDIEYYKKNPAIFGISIFKYHE